MTPTLQETQAKIETLMAEKREKEKQLKQVRKSLAKTRSQSRQILADTAQDITNIAAMTIGEVDHLIDIAKFFVGLSATGIFTAVGLKSEIANANLLLATSCYVFGASITVLAVSLYYRRKKLNKIFDLYYSRSKLFSKVYSTETPTSTREEPA